MGIGASGFGSGLLVAQPIKRKIFVSYHHKGDQAYYDAFSRTFSSTYDVLYDNSLERQIDSDNVDDPPLGAEEQRLFEDIAPNVRLRSLTEWLAGKTI